MNSLRSVSLSLTRARADTQTQDRVNQQTFTGGGAWGGAHDLSPRHRIPMARGWRKIA